MSKSKSDHSDLLVRVALGILAFLALRFGGRALEWWKEKRDDVEASKRQVLESEQIVTSREANAR